MGILVYCAFGAAALWLVLIWPGRGRKERMADFEGRLVAHRGLHDNGGPAPENSMAAFRAAVERGYGIELDVRLTADGQLVVFHDETLERAAGIPRRVADTEWSELRDVKLFGSEETIPRLFDVLAMVAGRVPLIVEIKCEEAELVDKAAEETAFHLDSYQGISCVESFHPMVLRWMKKNRPETLRGQLSERFRGIKSPRGIGAFFLSCCAANFWTKPDFIAYRWEHAEFLRFRLLRDLFHVETVGWTVRSEEELREASKDFDVLICEGFVQDYDPARPGPDRRPVRKMDHLIRKHMIVSGTVTAVGFRYRATYIAQSLGITGWVKNTWDERVEMEVQGRRELLDEMLRRLGEQRYIHIAGVEEEEIPVLEHEYEFKVRY